MKRNLVFTWFLIVVSVMLAACQPIRRDSTVESSPPSSQISAEVQPTPTDVPTAVPVQISLSAASTDSKPTAGAIFTKVSPSVAFIETASATGSGVLIDHGFLLSNAHVVWPYDKVRVVFPDGTEFLEVPVYAWDLMADIALIGPIETAISPIQLVDAGEVEIGSDVYLIGYPAEVDDFPQPTMTSGILSRVRTWDSINYSFFQVDATITGGQSGGVLVTQQGDVVGISTFYYRSFGLAGNVANAIDRINALLGNDTGVSLDNRPFAKGEGATEFSDTLLDKRDVRRYILQEAEDTDVTISAKGVGKPQIRVSKVAGYYIDGTKPENEESQEVELSFTVDEEVPYLIEVIQLSENKNEFTLDSSHALIPYLDPDDRQELSVDDTFVGNIDTATDTDVFSMTLKEGDVVELTLDTLSADPTLTIEYESDILEERVSDSNSGGGMFGQNAQLIYKAPKDDTYRVLVENYGYGGDVGGYFLSVRKADADAEVTELDTTRKLVPSAFGKLTWYEVEDYDLSFLYPVDWQNVPSAQCSPGATVCFGGPNGLIIVTAESLSKMPKKDRNREGYLKLLLDIISTNPAIDSIESEETTTLQNLPADRLDFSVQKGRAKAARIIYVDEEKALAISISFVSDSSLFDRSETLMRTIFDSMRIWQTDKHEETAVYHLDEGSAYSAAGEYEDALNEFTKSIELDPELMQAYARRAFIYQYQDEFELALADVSKAIELAPQDDDLYQQRALMYWIALDFEKALVDTDNASELAPQKAEILNLRALIHASLEQYEEALADLDEYESMIGDDLPPGVLDSRGYIYLKMGDFEKAREDYDAILNKDWRSPYPLLGAGIVYVHDGEVEEGEALIAEALEKFPEDSMQHPTPQLTDLLNLKKQVLEK